MRIAVISDIHGNLEALNAALKLIASLGIDEIACCGDLVGYGADPNACVELIRSLSKTVVCGNHDASVADEREIDYFTPVAAEAMRWTLQQLTPENRKYLESLPLVATAYDCTFVHSSPDRPELWNYITAPYQTQGMSRFFRTSLCFIGHTHVPGMYGEGKNADAIARSGKYIVNVGSVGQPRDGNPRFCFAVLDTAAWTVTFHRDTYDIDTAADKIINAGLPPTLAHRLYRGG